MTAAPDHPAAIRDRLPLRIPDVDPAETREWRESLDGVVDHAGRDRARHLVLSVLQRARERQVDVPGLGSADYINTDYINTIPPGSEPTFPGDEQIERRIRAYIRWNAAIMVHRAQRPGIGVGGHISTYASSAALYEVGFNHFFRGHSAPGGADQIYVQGHASPGIYARAYLEGRLSQDRLDGFRRELSHTGPGGGLPSYPHPRLMPEFWEFPTVNEPITQPSQPDDLDVDGVLAGMHRLSAAPEGDGPSVQILASGIAVPWALEAQRLLRRDWAVRADVWSVTSWTELRREALAADECNLLHPDGPRRIPYVTRRLRERPGPAVAVSDWMRAVPDQIAPFVPGRWTSLGTDGFGRSDTRPVLRRHLHVDAPSIVLRALEQLVDHGECDRSVLGQSIATYRLDDPPPRQHT